MGLVYPSLVLDFQLLIRNVVDSDFTMSSVDYPPGKNRQDLRPTFMLNC